MADQKAVKRVAVAELKSFHKLEADCLHNDGQAILTPEQARSLAAKLTQLTEAAESLGKPDPCLILVITEAHPGMFMLNEAHGAGIYVAPSTFSAETATRK